MNKHTVFEIKKLNVLGYHKTAMEMALEYIDTLEKEVATLEGRLSYHRLKEAE